MPVDFLNLLPQIRDFSDHAVERQSQAESSLSALRTSFAALAGRTDIEALVRMNLSGKQAAHIALPTDEAIDRGFPLPENARRPGTILAADGSQVIPNRHEEIRFGLINIGLFETRLGSGIVPVETVTTELLDEFSDGERLDEFRVSYLRDLSERCLIAEAVAGLASDREPVLALTDGPISIFQRRKPVSGAAGAFSPEDRRRIETAYQVMARRGVLYAGYIDRPGSDLVVRMAQTALNQETSESGPKTLTDAGLFASVLGPTERSAVFQLATVNSGMDDEEILAVYFFYLNLQGAQRFRTRKRATIARVEVPDWVAREPASIDTLHAALVAQAGMIDGMLYPYALQRAHEIALIRAGEKERIKRKLMNEMIRRGGSPRDKSEKQRSKDLIN